MNIFIKDDQGLDTILMMDGYSRTQRQELKQTIREKFRTVALKVYEEVLGKPLPETLVVNMAVSKKEELSGESVARLASYNLALSQMNSASFTIREITVKGLLENQDNTQFESTVIHEMFHAADRFVLEKNYKMFSDLRSDINDHTDQYGNVSDKVSYALMGILQVFNHYRAEGVAILGESLLMKSQFGSADDSTTQFCRIFELALVKSQMRLSGDDVDTFSEDIFHKAYAVAPIILLKVLEKSGGVESLLVQKALDGLQSGNFDLTDSEVITIMRAAVSLSLPGYIQGLMCLGDGVAPIRLFLSICAQIQGELDEDSVDALELLINQPTTAEAFNSAMEQIMGCCIPTEELNSLYDEFLENFANDPLYAPLKENMEKLYHVLNNGGNSDRSRIAQWALTYFFDDEDVIHDDVKGIGLVDDMIILEYAIKLL